MKTVATLLALALAAPAMAQTHEHAAMTAPAAPAAAAKFTLDTPIEALVADAKAKAKAVLDADLPGLTTNDKYEMFKSMSLTQVAGFAPDKMTPERMAKTAADLAAIK